MKLDWNLLDFVSAEAKDSSRLCKNLICEPPLQINLRECSMLLNQAQIIQYIVTETVRRVALCYEEVLRKYFMMTKEISPNE